MEYTIDSGKTLVKVTPDALEYYHLGEKQYLKSRVSLPTNDPQSKGTIWYYSEQHNLQATYHGTLLRTKSQPTDQLALVINPLVGEMERQANPEQFGLILAGHFGGSTRLKSGAMILPEYDIIIRSSRFMYILSGSPQTLQDVYLVSPQLESIRSGYDPTRYEILYQQSAVQMEGLPCLSMKKVVQILSRGNYQRLVEHYSNLLRECRQYGQRQIQSQVEDPVIKETIVEGLCNLVFLEVTHLEVTHQELHPREVLHPVKGQPAIPTIFDQLLQGQVTQILTHGQHLRSPEHRHQHPYQRPNQPWQVMNQGYYQRTKTPMSIQLQPDELEILVPFALDANQHLYYQWQLIGGNTDLSDRQDWSLLVDTGNHAISGMSWKYFQQVYLKQVPVNVRDQVIQKILDTHTPKVKTCGVGGECVTRHMGYVELIFRFSHFHHKGIFTIDCDVNQTDLYDLLIGDQNKPESQLPASNMKTLLRDHQIFLQSSLS